ncbi:MAG: glycosyltransferase family 4 protein, partial [Steroidobacteraceae bacterium]
TDVSAEAVVVLPDFSVASEPQGVPPNDLRGLAKSGEALALYVGNLGHYQGIELLLEAVALLGPDIPCRFAIVGGPEDARGRLELRAEQLGIADRVLLPGPRPVEQLGILMAQADILLSPRLEGVNTPMKVYAYMQSGVALLATDIRSHSQVLDHTTAELVPVTPEGLAAGIRRLLADPDRRRQIGESARQLALREYTPAAYRRRLAGAYAGLIARVSPKSAPA